MGKREDFLVLQGSDSLLVKMRRDSARFFHDHPSLVAPVFYIFIHVLLLIGYDRSHPDVLMQGDRAPTRLAWIQEVRSSTTFQEFAAILLSKGAPGDYVIHAALFEFGDFFGNGRLILVLLQIVLNALSLVLVYFISRMSALSVRGSLIATLFYAVLPHTTAFPHMLVSEAIFVPVTIGSVYVSMRSLEMESRKIWIAFAALLWFLAALIRPSILLFPIVFAVIALITHRWRIHSFMGFVIMYCALVCVWVVPSMVLTGRPNLAYGPPDAWPRTMYNKALYVIESLDTDARVQESQELRGVPQEEYRATELVKLYFRHPLQGLYVVALDVGKVTLKFDETKVLNYLGIWSAEDEWGKDLVRGSVGRLFFNQPFVFIAVIVGSLFWFATLIMASWGVTWSHAKRLVVPHFLTALCLYTIVTSLPVDFTQGRHRWPADFAICILAVAGYGKRYTQRLIDLPDGFST
jgi:hypothetical protein